MTGNEDDGPDSDRDLDGVDHHRPLGRGRFAVHKDDEDCEDCRVPHVSFFLGVLCQDREEINA